MQDFFIREVFSKIFLCLLTLIFAENFLIYFFFLLSSTIWDEEIWSFSGIWLPSDLTVQQSYFKSYWFYTFFALLWQPRTLRHFLNYFLNTCYWEQVTP